MEIANYLKDEFASNGDLYRQAIRHLSSASVRDQIMASDKEDWKVMFKAREWLVVVPDAKDKRGVFTWLAELYWAVFVMHAHKATSAYVSLSDDERAYIDCIHCKLMLLCRSHWDLYTPSFDRPVVYLGGALKRLMAMRARKMPMLNGAVFYRQLIERCNNEKDDIINTVNEKANISF